MSEDRAIVHSAWLIIGANIALWTGESWAPILASGLIIFALIVLRHYINA